MHRSYNPNPAGAKVGDCAVRAVAKATGASWERAYAGLCAAGFDVCDLPSADRVWGVYLRDKGFKRRALPESLCNGYAVRDFAREHLQKVFTCWRLVGMLCA